MGFGALLGGGAALGAGAMTNQDTQRRDWSSWNGPLANYLRALRDWRNPEPAPAPAPQPNKGAIAGGAVQAPAPAPSPAAPQPQPSRGALFGGASPYTQAGGALFGGALVPGWQDDQEDRFLRLVQVLNFLRGYR